MTPHLCIIEKQCRDQFPRPHISRFEFIYYVCRVDFRTTHGSTSQTDPFASLELQKTIARRFRTSYDSPTSWSRDSQIVKGPVRHLVLKADSMQYSDRKGLSPKEQATANSRRHRKGWRELNTLLRVWQGRGKTRTALQHSRLVSSLLLG